MQTEKPTVHYAALAPKERAQHGQDVILESIWVSQQTIRARSRVRNPLQLDLLHHRKGKGGFRNLDFNPYLAGLRVSFLFGVAGLRQRTVMRYDDAMHRGDYQNSVARAGDAYHAWHKAMAIVTPWAADEVFEVCCQDQKPGGSIRMEFLRRGLQLLYDRRNDWWGMTVDDGDLTLDGA
jgi:hypothetical protein